jgi:hypothetical protein
LSKIHLAPAAVVFNRMPPSEFDADDITALTNRRAPRSHKKDLDHLAELAKSELTRVAEARKALAKIRTETGSPVLEIPEHSGISGIELIDRVTTDLVSYRENESVPRAAHRH